MDKLIIPLKHYNMRPVKAVIDLVVIHYISAINLNKESWSDLGLILGIFGQYSLSAHYLIERDGRVIETINPVHRAWHAGKSKYKGKSDCNDFSIGIEVVGGQFIDFETEQYNSLNELIKELKDSYPIQNIVGHEEIAIPKGRKKDPGERFRWEKLKIT
ncbi:N-acetylmuramoyl-L-alanine amidase [bacterium]|nr:N-acetylmuramoyl-L-alanine amidase [bacterium]|tara:strand:- start:17989 stop:18465 length:477 start_codon:yes stop_codon:yes gene_type:complete